MNADVITNFRILRNINTPIILIEDFDYARVDDLLMKAVGGEDAVRSKIVRIEEWNPATGNTTFTNKETKGFSFEPLETFLRGIYTDDISKERFVILKDIGRYLEEPTIQSLLQMIAQRELYDRKWNTIIVIVSNGFVIPGTVLKYSSYLDIPFPNDDEIDELILSHVSENNYTEEFDQENLPVIREALRGMSRYDIDRVLDMAMSKNGTLSADDDSMIRQQKKAMVKKSGLVEYVDTKDLKLNDIGGLMHLKEYLKVKREIFKNLSKAKEKGVKTPKGLFIVGMPGCGKSLCAKVVASTFGMPLLKLDMGSMMGKYVGQSEANLRNAIKIAEATAPCILWLDEIEKAFSGTGGHNDVLTRMFGYFLSWMQEKTSSVYVVATANSADNLPPELKRKGRFDEIFCVNLPTAEERKAIFEVHYNKLPEGVYPKIDFTEVSKDSYTEGFNGADIESVINELVEKCFTENKELTEEVIKKVIKEVINSTVSISRSCGEQIKSMEEVFSKSSFKDATTGRLTKKR